MNPNKFWPLFASVTITIQDNISYRSGYASMSNTSFDVTQLQNLHTYSQFNGAPEIAGRLVTYVHMALIQWMEEMEKAYADAQK